MRGAEPPKAAAPVAPGAGFDRELNVRGERVEDAIEKVRDLVDEAQALQIESVRVLHGKGTGALRDAVRRYLRDERRVERFEDAVPYEGGHGVTVAYLRVDLRAAPARVAWRMPRPRAIVFDLDGTLVDSLPDIVGAFHDAFADHGLTAPPEAAVRDHVGLPLEAMYAEFAPAEHVAALVAAYRRIYPQRFTRTSRPFPGVPEVLAELRRHGFRLAVATTKRSDMATRFVAAMGLEDALDHVQGTDGFPHKPAPDVVLRALAALDAEGTWMVGDTIHDVGAGRAAGLATYAVTWGTHDAETLAAAAPDRLEPDLATLVAAVLG